MLEYGKYYHVFNKSIDGQNIFHKETDYLHFLKLIEIFIIPIADLYAYALMGNHFHFAVKIKSISEIGFLNPEYSRSKNLLLKWKTYPLKEMSYNNESYLRKPDPEFMLQHLSNAYAKWHNKKYNLKGRLLKKSLIKKEITNKHSLKRIILYIHNNPVKHGFCNHPIEYGWTSYIAFAENQQTFVKKETVINWFDTPSNFISLHNNTGDDFFDISPILIE